VGIQREYVAFVESLEVGETLERQRQRPGHESSVGLRHDIDYSLDAALEMASLEASAGVTSTFFLLHTAPYMTTDSRAIEKLLQIQDFGHEVGLHLNVLTSWFEGTTDDPATALAQVLDPLRSAGLDISGVSAHGDRSCYENSFINYWLFRDLRTDDPSAREHMLSAEGIKVSAPSFQIPYPTEHALTRSDGATFDLWTLDMADFGLTYEASHLHYDEYFSDSGGSFTRTTSPVDHDLTTGRFQVLTHPKHWLVPRQKFFFLSTARCGSTWLTNQLHDATNLVAQHEFSLNHRVDDSGTPDKAKRTGTGLTELLDNDVELEQLLRQARGWIEQRDSDYGEANVYLAHATDAMRAVFPDSFPVHLVRHPALVVTSLMERGWYENPDDTRYPIFDLPSWHALTPFAKTCWYVRLTNELIQSLGAPVLRLEDLTESLDRFQHQLAEIGISVFPNFLTSFENVANANITAEFPNYDDWTPHMKWDFESILGSHAKRFDYPLDPVPPPPRSTDRVVLGQRASELVTTELVDLRSQVEGGRIFAVGCTIGQSRIVPDGGRHGYVLLGGGRWAKVVATSGWDAQPGVRYRGRISATLDGGSGALLMLEFGDDGTLLKSRSVARLGHERVTSFAFQTAHDATNFNLAIHMRSDDLPASIEVHELLLETVTVSGND